MSKIKKALKKIGKAALIGGAGYLAMKGLKNRKENKAFLKTEGGDRSDMRDYGPFTKKRSSYIADNRTPSVLGQGSDRTGQVDYSGISDRMEDASAAKGGRIVKTKGGGKAVRGLGRAFTKRKK